MDKYWEKAKSPLKRNERVREYLSEGRKIKEKKENVQDVKIKGEKKVRQTNRKKRKKKIVSR